MLAAAFAVARSGLRIAVFGMALLVMVGTAPAQGAAEVPARDGLFLTVPNPITSSVVEQLKNKVKDAQKNRRLKTIVFDFNVQGPAATSDFGICYSLASFIRSLRLEQAIHTVAFVHDKTTRHTVLPVLACGEIIMSGTTDPKTQMARARLGDVLDGQDRPLDGPKQAAYLEEARNFPSPGLVLKMFDRTLELRRVRTDQGVLYLSPAEIAQRQMKGEALAVEPGVPPGLEAGTLLYDAPRAREFGLCRALYNTRGELAAALKLPRQALSEDWLMGRNPVAWRIEVKGPLDKGRLQSLERRIKTALSRGANLLIFELSSEGGDTEIVPTMARDIGRLVDDINHLPVKTIAYIPPGRSLGAATFLALGCDEMVMGTGAVLGDFEYLKKQDAKLLNDVRANLVDLAQKQGYPPRLFEAMVDPRLMLRRVQSRADPHDFRVVTEEELRKDQESGKPQWHGVPAGGLDRPEGQFFKLPAALAKELGVVLHADKDSNEAVSSLYNLDPLKVRLARDDWLDRVAEFFREPTVNVVLIMLGIVGLILELKMPGVGLPGVMAAVCFILFFWAHSFTGEFTMLAVLLFVLGLILIAIEVFVFPGFGVTGISGITLIIGALALVTLEKMPETTQDWLNLGATLTTFGVSLMGAITVAFVLAWYLPHIPYANRLVLAPPTEGDESALTSAESPISSALLGAIGTAATPLRPAGKARFGDDFLDVIAEGDYVIPGTRVQVIEIEGNRIVVKAI